MLAKRAADVAGLLFIAGAVFWGLDLPMRLGWLLYTEQFLAAATHLALRREEIFRRRFVRSFRVRSDVAQSIDIAGVLRVVAANEAATFSRGHFASMSNHCLEMFAKERERGHLF